MKTFVRVAELASFTRAAESLGMPKASASTAVQQLESNRGTRLLHRTTRKVRLTQDGQAFYQRCRDVLSEVDELQSMFQRGDQQLRGSLRVDMSAGVALNFVIERLPEFLAAHPLIELELSTTDRLVDVVREGFDCVLRTATLADSSLIARPLGAFRVINCASPAYLERFGTPRSLEDLGRHRMIHYVSALGARSSGWEYPDGHVYRSVPMEGALTVNSTSAYTAACVAGLGLIQAPAVGLQPLSDRGLLVEVLRHYPAAPMPVSLLYANRRNLPRRVQAFMGWVAGVLAPYVEPINGAGAPSSPSKRSHTD